MGNSDGVEEKKGSGLHAREGEGKKEGEKEEASHPGDSLPLKAQKAAVNSFKKSSLTLNKEVTPIFIEEKP